jgi:uncharacterized ion transporter superfamily protein YfcC
MTSQLKANMGAFQQSSISVVLFALVIAIVIFLICREIVCWYFKYNAMVHELAAIRIAVIDQVKAQQVTNAAIYETNQLLARLVGVPPVRNA